MLVQRALSSPESSPSIVAAGKVQTGDRLWTMPEGPAAVGPSRAGQLMWSKVTAVRETYQQGLYNPHTPEGTMVVNGIAACTFPDRIHASLDAHWWIALPARLLHKLLMHNAMRTAVNNALLEIYFGLRDAYARCASYSSLSSLVAHVTKVA